MSVFFDRFTALCKEMGETPNSFAKKMGIPSGSITAWKKGVMPRTETINKLAARFGVSADYLLGNVSEPYFYLDNDRIKREINSYGDDEEKEPTPVFEDGPTLPPEYKFLNPANKAIVDRLIADLVKSQPPRPTVKLSVAALGGDDTFETEADADITLPEKSVQALPDEYKGKTADTTSAPQEK